MRKPSKPSLDKRLTDYTYDLELLLEKGELPDAVAYWAEAVVIDLKKMLR